MDLQVSIWKGQATFWRLVREIPGAQGVSCPVQRHIFNKGFHSKSKFGILLWKFWRERENISHRYYHCSINISFHLKINLLINQFLVALDLHCHTWAFSSCGVQASHCGGFSCCGARTLKQVGFSSCGPQAQLLLGMLNLQQSVIKLVSPALVAGFSTTGPPGKSRFVFCVSAFPPQFGFFSFLVFCLKKYRIHEYILTV